jgi:hypothetical protein
MYTVLRTPVVNPSLNRKRTCFACSLLACEALLAAASVAIVCTPGVLLVLVMTRPKKSRLTDWCVCGGVMC